MVHWESYTQIMANSMLVLPLQISALNGVSPMKLPVHTIHNPMDLLSHVSKQSSIRFNMPSTVVQIQGSHYSISRPHQALITISAQILYNCKIYTTIPSRIQNTDPAALQVQDCLEDFAEQANSNADRHSEQLAQVYSGQPIATFDTLRKIWIPTTVVCILLKDSYQMHTANGTIYHHARHHIWE